MLELIDWSGTGDGNQKPEGRKQESEVRSRETEVGRITFISAKQDYIYSSPQLRNHDAAQVALYQQ
jgi:hypothetical protein